MTTSSNGQLALDKIVNVASVPKRSPFRYPGGKTWLIPYIREWLRSLPEKPAELIEPFVGGGIVSLTVAAERLANHVIMVELDDQVAAVWHTLISGDGVWLANEIAAFELTPENVDRVLASTPHTTEEKAFRTILKNRVNRGGILAPGASKIKYGENGKGIASRWYPQTLKQRMLDIVAMRERITFIEGDGLAVLRQYADNANAAYFIDPPYTAAGKKAGSRLYSCSELDHEELFRIIHTLSGDPLITYDDAEDVRQLARGLDTELVPMKNTHHAEMTELLIGRNLDWVRRGREVQVGLDI